jgi:nucleoside-diphosphate-sugar epimerase
MKVTVLGSGGQIGAYLTEYLRKKGHEVTEFDIVNGEEQDITKIPNPLLMRSIRMCDFVFFLAFDVGGSRYLKKYQHTFDFINNNTRMSNMSYSPYGVMKRVGELYTQTLKGLTVHFWNVYGIENDAEKSHVITDFIRKGFEEGDFEMMTDGTEERQFLYAEDCCEALETVMNSYTDFKPEDELHITSFRSSTIKEVAEIIQGQFNLIGKSVSIKPGLAKDSVQMDKRNQPNNYITGWWMPKTNLQDGIAKVFEDMKGDWI